MSTEYSALMSKVMSNSNGRIKFPINEPAKGKKKSQIEEIPGTPITVPACSTSPAQRMNIVRTVTALRNQGVDFCTVPQNHHEMSPPARIGSIDERFYTLADWGSWPTGTTKGICSRY